MKNRLDEAADMLQEHKASCVILYEDREPYLSGDKGVKPLMVCLRQDRHAFAGGVIADKVVGKAAALLAVLGRASAVYGGVMSEPAIEILKKQGIYYEYREKVPYIINRTGTGGCPMEAAVLHTDDPVEAFKILESTILRLMSQKEN